MAQSIQTRPTPNKLDQAAKRLLRLPPARAAAVLTARWKEGRETRSIHPTISSLILARMYCYGPDKTSLVVTNIIAQREIKLEGEDLLTEKGWVDLAVEILSLGVHRVSSVEIKRSPGSSPYTIIVDRTFHSVASAQQVNQGALLDIKCDPRRRFVR